MFIVATFLAGITYSNCKATSVELGVIRRNVRRFRVGVSPSLFGSLHLGFTSESTVKISTAFFKRISGYQSARKALGSPWSPAWKRPLVEVGRGKRVCMPPIMLALFLFIAFFRDQTALSKNCINTLTKSIFRDAR